MTYRFGVVGTLISTGVIGSAVVLGSRGGASIDAIQIQPEPLGAAELRERLQIVFAVDDDLAFLRAYLSLVKETHGDIGPFTLHGDRARITTEYMLVFERDQEATVVALEAMDTSRVCFSK